MCNSDKAKKDGVHNRNLKRIGIGVCAGIFFACILGSIFYKNGINIFLGVGIGLLFGVVIGIPLQKNENDRAKW